MKELLGAMIWFMNISIILTVSVISIELVVMAMRGK